MGFLSQLARNGTSGSFCHFCSIKALVVVIVVLKGFVLTFPPRNLNLFVAGLTGLPFEIIAACSPLHLSVKTTFLEVVTSARGMGPNKQQ